MLDLAWEYALIKFSGKKFSGKIVPVLLDLAERGIVRFVDPVFIQKEKNGSTRTIKLSDLEPAVYKMFVPMGKQFKKELAAEKRKNSATNKSAVKK